MEDNIVQKIKSNKKYHKLVSTRSTYGWTLTWIMMIAYYGYILLVAFNKDLLGTRMGAGVTTWGIPIGLFVIIFTVILTGIYVRRANREFDDLTSEIRKEVM